MRAAVRLRAAKSSCGRVSCARSAAHGLLCMENMVCCAWSVVHVTQGLLCVKP